MSRTPFPHPSEDPYTKTPNIFYDEYMDLGPYTWIVLGAIIRKTYGWHKDKEQISHGTLVKMTHLSEKQVRRAIDHLVAEKVIERESNFHSNGSQQANTYKIIFARESQKDDTPSGEGSASWSKTTQPEIPQLEGGGPTDQGGVVQQTRGGGPTDHPLKETSLKETEEKKQQHQRIGSLEAEQVNAPNDVVVFSDEERKMMPSAPPLQQQAPKQAAQLAKGYQQVGPMAKLNPLPYSSFFAQDEDRNPVPIRHQCDQRFHTMNPLQKQLYSRFMALRTMNHNDSGIDPAWAANVVTAGVLTPFEINEVLETFINDCETYAQKGKKIDCIGGYLTNLLRNPRKTANPICSKNKTWWDEQKTSLNPKAYDESREAVHFKTLGVDLPFNFEHNNFKELLAGYFRQLTQPRGSLGTA